MLICSTDLKGWCKYTNLQFLLVLTSVCVFPCNSKVLLIYVHRLPSTSLRPCAHKSLIVLTLLQLHTLFICSIQWQHALLQVFRKLKTQLGTASTNFWNTFLNHNIWIYFWLLSICQLFWKPFQILARNQ